MKSFKIKKRKQRRPVTAKVTGLLEKPKLPLRVFWNVHKLNQQIEFVYKD